MAKEFTMPETLSGKAATVALAPGESDSIGAVALQIGDVLVFAGDLDQVIVHDEYAGHKYTKLIDTTGREVSLKQLVRNRNGLEFPAGSNKLQRLQMLATAIEAGGLTLTVADVVTVEGMYNGVKTMQKQYKFTR